MGAEGLTLGRMEKIRELQFLMCTILFNCHGPDLGVKRLRQYLLVLRKLARYSDANDKGLLDVLADSNHLEAFLKLQSLSALSNFMRLLRSLYTRRRACDHFEVARIESWESLLLKELKYYQSRKQNVPLPTRIYSELITNIDEEIDFLERHLGSALLELENVLNSWTTGNYKSEDGIKNYPNLCYLVDRYSKPRNVKGIDAVFKIIHIICKLQIHLFSGMRSEEVMYLPFYCLKTIGGNGRNYALLVGLTTKIRNGKRLSTQWVTTAETGHRAVKIVQSVSRFIYKSINVFPERNDNNKDKYRLFLSTDYLPWAQRYDLDQTGTTPFGVLNGTGLMDFGNSLLADKLIPSIGEQDIKELEDIEPFRDWQAEVDFQVGKKWPLKMHQLRRSIALYARSSGVVGVSTLRRQLQHISNDMSSYYSNGSAFAKSFLTQDPEGFKKHVVYEWQQTTSEVEVLSFMREVLRTEEPLYGGAGNFYYNQIKRGELLERGDIEKAVKEGTLAYRSSPIGGCTKPGQCTINTGLSLFNLICATEGCKHLVGKPSKGNPPIFSID